MIYYTLTCKLCNHEYVRTGTDAEPDTNAWEITDKRGSDCPECGSDDWEVIDQDVNDEP